MNNKKCFPDGPALHKSPPNSQRPSRPSQQPTACVRANRIPAVLLWLVVALVYSCPCTAWAVPAAPTNLVAEPRDAEVKLIWDIVPGATNYKIYRRTDPLGAWQFMRNNNDNDSVEANLNNDSVETNLINDTTYYYMVRATDGTGSSANSNEVSATPIAPPTVPVNLTATASSAQVTLNWDMVASATSYKVKRATSSRGAYSIVASPVTDDFVDTGKTNGVTYYYRIYAVNGSGDGPDSLTVSATPRLTAPANLTATAANAQVALAWNAVAGASSYKVCRSTVAGGPYTFIANNTDTDYTDATASNHTTYFYVVIAVDGSGESPNSNEATATPRAVPTVPTGLTAIAANGQVSLTWNEVTHATSYSIQRKSGSGSFAVIGTSAIAGYLDTTPTNGTTYSYIVRAINVGGQSANSATVSSTPRVTAPANLTATPGNTQITLSWNAVPGATGYKVKRGIVTGNYTSTQTVAATSTGYAWTGLTNGTTYYFVVVATDSAGESPASNQASGAPYAPPVAPTGLAAIAGNAQVSLSWNAVTGATGYVLQRKPSGGSFSTVATPATNSQLDVGLTNGTQYVYRVAASNGAGTGGYSSELNTNTTPKLTPPTNFTATARSAQVILSWNAVPNASGYKVKRGTVTGNYPTTQTLSGNDTTTYTWTGLINGTTYYFTVEATAPISSGSSTNSTEASATPQLTAPVNVVATPGNAQIVLTWTAVGGAASYQVWRSTTTGGTYTQVGTPTGASFTNSALTNGTTYFYVVKAVAGATVSTASMEVSGTSLAAPAAPTGLAGTAAPTQITLTWNAVPGAASYKVQRKPNGGSYATVTTPNTNAYLDTGLTNGTLYYYKVSAINANGLEGSTSSEINIRPRVVPPLNVLAVPGYTQATISWDVVPGATAYKVKRGTTIGNYTLTQTVAATSTSYTWTGLANGTLYHFVVVATDAFGDSANSGEVTATPANAPAVPTGFSAVGGNNQVSLSWNPVAGAGSYKVKRSMTQGGPYTVIAGSVNTNSYSDITDVENGKTYYYVVSAVGPGGESGNSAEAGAQPLPPAPDVPGAPTFSEVSGSTLKVKVTGSALPTYAESLTLQLKLADQGEDAYEDWMHGLASGVETVVYGLDPGEEYAFRYVAVGMGGFTPGPEAVVEMANRMVTWSAESTRLDDVTIGPAEDGIHCKGIYFPENGATLVPNGTGLLNAFLASDWDQRTVTLDGDITSSELSDPCSYVWTVRNSAGNDVGDFGLKKVIANRQYGLGQSVYWTAPSAPGTYTVTLTVDDQNDDNKGIGDFGSRILQGADDNDVALVFTQTITVQ